MAKKNKVIELDEKGREFQIKRCKVCGELKRRIFDGYYPDGVNKCWIGEDGHYFNGLICSTCNLERLKKNSDKYYDRNKTDETESS